MRMTLTHDPAPADLHGALLCDADLAVLGSSPQRYGRYAADVRREYAHVDDAAFREGRTAVLRTLLEQPAALRDRRRGAAAGTPRPGATCATRSAAWPVLRSTQTGRLEPRRAARAPGRPRRRARAPARAGTPGCRSGRPGRRVAGRRAGPRSRAARRTTRRSRGATTAARATATRPGRRARPPAHRSRRVTRDERDRRPRAAAWRRAATGSGGRAAGRRRRGGRHRCDRHSRAAPVR